MWKDFTEAHCTDSSIRAKRFLHFSYVITILPFTISCTIACACPKMLTAEQLYAPESLRCTFFRSIFPPETTDRLDCLFILLHTMTGSGLPLTEHWNEADAPSLTVSVLGDTATTGAEIDSPGSPLAPGMPAGPMSPFCPLSPTSPFGPTGPMMPCLPLFPGDPIMPWSPSCPLRPRDPLSPFGPGGPGGPGRQLSPFEWHSWGFSSDNNLFIFRIVSLSTVILAPVVFFRESAARLFLWSLTYSVSTMNVYNKLVLKIETEDPLPS